MQGRRVAGGSSEQERHPVDTLIRELVHTRRSPSREEVQQIRERVAQAPFQDRIVPVRTYERGVTYQGRTVQSRDDAGFIHLVRRVVIDQQWADGTTMLEYVSDLHELAHSSESDMFVYDRGNGCVVGILGKNAIPRVRLGSEALTYLFVVYSADRSSIITGYQISGLDQIDISESPLWLA